MMRSIARSGTIRRIGRGRERVYWEMTEGRKKPDANFIEILCAERPLTDAP